MQTTRIEIGDGVNFCAVGTQKFKHAVLSIGFTAKLTPENAAMNSLLVAVLTKSCARFPKMEDFNRELDRLYAASINGNSRKCGEVHLSMIDASVLRNKYVPDGEDIEAQMTELLLDVVFAPALKDGVFDAAIVESEKKNLIDTIRASSNNKDGYAVRRCGEVMCENERYSTYIYGSEEEVEKITTEALTEAYYRALLSSKFEIYYVGDYDAAALSEKFKARFESVKRNLSIDVPSTKVKKKVTGEVREYTEHQSITQAKLSLGFRLGRSLADRNFAAISLFSEIYGGCVTSKLFTNVREKLSLCYYCTPVVESIKGIMIVASAIDPANKEKAQAEILAQLDAIKNGDISDEEFKSAKDSLINKYKETEDSAMAIIRWYYTRSILGFVDSPALASMAISYLTKPQVIEAAQDVMLDTVYLLTGMDGKDVE